MCQIGALLIWRCLEISIAFGGSRVASIENYVAVPAEFWSSLCETYLHVVDEVL